MKKSLLTTAAAVALLAGTSLASAQGMKADQGAPAAQQKAPEIKAQGQADDKAKAQAQPTQKSEKPAAQNAQQPAKRETTGQSQPAEQKPAPQRSQAPAAAPKDAQSQQKADDKPAAQSTQAPAQRTPNAAAQGQQTGTSVSLNAEQKTKIRASVLQGSGTPRVTNVNFTISVGTVVPRTVRLAPISPVLVEVHPAWRGYMYFVVGDEIIVVEPRTLQIVAVLVV